MNRRFSIGSTGATAWSKLPLHSLWTLLLQIHRRPSDVPVPQWRIFRCPSDHVSISFKSGQTYTGDYTDVLFSIPSDLPVLRVGGPARPVSLNRSAGPASQSHAHPPFFLANRRPRPRSAATRPLAAAAPHAPPLRRRTRIAPPHPRLARSAPTPPASRPRRACAPALRLFLAAPPLITVANGLLNARSPSCSTPLEFPPRFEP